MFFSGINKNSKYEKAGTKPACNLSYGTSNKKIACKMSYMPKIITIFAEITAE